MPFITRRTTGMVGILAIAATIGALAWQPSLARAGAPPGTPLVLPAQCLPYLGQLNGGTRFSVVCLSQAPVPGTGGVAQTAVVDLSPPAGMIGPGGSFSLFMFPQDVPAVQQLNRGVQISPNGFFQLPSTGSGSPTQIEQVQVTAPVQSQAGAIGCLFVCPVTTLPVLGQLNPELSFDILSTSQIGTGKATAGAQTALLEIQPASGKLDSSQPLSLWVPIDTLPTLGQLNAGASMDVIDVTEMPAGISMLPVALVDVRQNPQPLSSVSTSQSGTSSATPPDSSNDDSGDDDGVGKDKGHEKGNGKGHHKKGDD